MSVLCLYEKDSHNLLFISYCLLVVMSVSDLDRVFLWFCSSLLLLDGHENEDNDGKERKVTDIHCKAK